MNLLSSIPMASFAMMAATLFMNVLVWGEDPLPDLTKGISGIDRRLTYNLGATGMRGWIYTPHERQNISQADAEYGRQTGASRQILVTHIGANSPASGVMQVNDIILGIDDKPFTFDARKSLAYAIQESEKSPVSGAAVPANKTRSGSLVLLRWRAGKTESVELKMRVMGTYSATAPYNCPKSAKILEEAMIALPKETDMWPQIQGIAMLATGDARFKAQIEAIVEDNKGIKYDFGEWVWEYSYTAIFLCEYYLKTGDKSVIPAIKELCVTFAKGQSMYGTMGHGLADPTDDGKTNGSIPPYGPVNEAGLAANIAIALAKRCLENDTDSASKSAIDAALVRANGFFGYFVDKGYLNYGEHEPIYSPTGGHANNGKGPMAAVLFGVQDRVRETQYWAKMCVASYPNTHMGHTGQGFSYLWRMVGADLGGPQAAAAFFKEMSWHFDLARRSDGSFTYDGGEQYDPGEVSGNDYYGHSSYFGVSPTACHILSYAVALKNLTITGKALKPVHLTTPEVNAAIAAGRFEQDQKLMSVPELTTALDNWSPTVRIRAASELSKRPGTQSLVPQLLKDVEGSNVWLRMGACEALNQLRAPQALPVFIRLLYHEDRGMRWLAALAIHEWGSDAQPALNDILQALADTAEPLTPVNFADPLQFARRRLTDALFSGGLREYLAQADPKMVLKAVAIAASNPDSVGRGVLEGYLDGMTVDDVKALLPEIVELATSHGPGNTMFSREIRVAAFKVLVKFRFTEAIKAAPLVARGKYGSHNVAEVMKLLETYGSAAKPIISDLQNLLIHFEELSKTWIFPDVKGPINNAITVIKNSTNYPVLIDKEILTFNFPGLPATTISGTNITVTVSTATNVTALAPTYTMSALAAGSPASGIARNFSTPQTYTITAQNGSTKTYTVTVQKASLSAAKDILTFNLPGLSPTTISGTNITLTVPTATNLILAPTYTVSALATGFPASGITRNFSTPQTYTITAQDGSTKDYSVTVNPAINGNAGQKSKGDEDGRCGLGAISASLFLMFMLMFMVIHKS